MVVAEVAGLLRTGLVNDVLVAHQRPDLCNHLLVNFGHSAPMTGNVLVVLQMDYRAHLIRILQLTLFVSLPQVFRLLLLAFFHSFCCRHFLGSLH